LRDPPGSVDHEPGKYLPYSVPRPWSLGEVYANLPVIYFVMYKPGLNAIGAGFIRGQVGGT
jgi:hypothetical protein